MISKMLKKLFLANFVLCFGFCMCSGNPNITSHPTSVISPAGSNVSFSCEATGSPLPDIVWKKSSGKLVSHNRSIVNQTVTNETRSSTLQLLDINAEDAGIYMCYVNNTAGNETSRTANLTLEEPPTTPSSGSGDGGGKPGQGNGNNKGDLSNSTSTTASSAQTNPSGTNTVASTSSSVATEAASTSGDAVTTKQSSGNDVSTTSSERVTNAPNQEGTTTPNQGGTTAPNQGGTTAPNQGGTTAPNQGGTTAPNQGGTNAPNQGGTTAPNQGGTTAPNQGGTNAPNQGGTTAPNQGGTNAPNQGGTTAPNQGGTTAPNQGGTTAPNQGGTTAPNQGGTTAPNQGGTTAPNQGGTTAPNQGGTTAPNQGVTSSSGGDGGPTTTPSTIPAQPDKEASVNIHMVGQFTNALADNTTTEFKQKKAEVDNAILPVVKKDVAGVRTAKSGVQSFKNGSIIAIMIIYIDPKADPPQNISLGDAIERAIVTANSTNKLGSLNLIGIQVYVSTPQTATADSGVSNDDDGGLEGYQIALIVIFILILLGIGIFVLFVVLHKKNTETGKEMAELHNQEQEHYHAQTNQIAYENINANQNADDAV